MCLLCLRNKVIYYPIFNVSSKKSWSYQLLRAGRRWQIVQCNLPDEEGMLSTVALTHSCPGSGWIPHLQELTGSQSSSSHFFGYLQRLESLLLCWAEIYLPLASPYNSISAFGATQNLSPVSTWRVTFMFFSSTALYSWLWCSVDYCFLNIFITHPYQ